jgi:hypothetical protein
MTIPSDTQVAEIVRRIHAAPHRACIAVTGIGSLFVAWLFSEPGASRTVLDVQVPYSGAALDEYTGQRAWQHVSTEEAMKMAQAALRRAQRLAAADGTYAGGPLIGLGCTGAIATDRVRRGEDRLHVTWTEGVRSRTYSLTFIKGARDRKGEERTGSALILNALAEACGLKHSLPLHLLRGEAVVES